MCYGTQHNGSQVAHSTYAGSIRRFRDYHAQHIPDTCTTLPRLRFAVAGCCDCTAAFHRSTARTAGSHAPAARTTWFTRFAVGYAVRLYRSAFFTLRTCWFCNAFVRAHAFGFIRRVRLVCSEHISLLQYGVYVAADTPYRAVAVCRLLHCCAPRCRTHYRYYLGHRLPVCVALRLPRGAARGSLWRLRTPVLRLLPRCCGRTFRVDVPH